MDPIDAIFSTSLLGLPSWIITSILCLSLSIWFFITRFEEYSKYKYTEDGATVVPLSSSHKIIIIIFLLLFSLILTTITTSENIIIQNSLSRYILSISLIVLYFGFTIGIYIAPITLLYCWLQDVLPDIPRYLATISIDSIRISIQNNWLPILIILGNLPLCFFIYNLTIIYLNISLILVLLILLFAMASCIKNSNFLNKPHAFLIILSLMFTVCMYAFITSLISNTVYTSEVFSYEKGSCSFSSISNSTNITYSYNTQYTFNFRLYNLKNYPEVIIIVNPINLTNVSDCYYYDSSLNLTANTLKHCNDDYKLFIPSTSNISPGAINLTLNVFTLEEKTNKSVYLPIYKYTDISNPLFIRYDLSDCK